MKKFTAIVLSLGLTIGLLAGCGDDYTAENSTVFVLKGGEVVSTDVEDFDTATYDEASFKAFVNQEIDEYTSTYGADSVSLKDCVVEDNKATLTIEYASTADYTKFNGVELFNGTLAEALAAGYSFDGDFAAIDGSNITACDSASFLSEEGLKVVVIKGNVNVKVPGTVVYVSANNTKLIESDIIGIAEGINIITGEAIAAEDTEATSEVTSEVTTEAAEPEVVDGGSIDEDDLEAGDTEAASVEFNFSDDSASGAVSSYTTVYTFIIYK